MKFLFADSMDHVDPGYDFLNDRYSEGREIYWDDKYPHEIMDRLPYDGMLISHGIVGDHKVCGKYTEAQAMRFRRVGAREFLRLKGKKYDDFPVFGDCGAFTYVREEMPPYTALDMVEFYGDAGFSHGCSVDHIIFDFDRSDKNPDIPSSEAIRRFEITVNNAEEFKSEARTLGKKFTPLGVVQGWSPSSMANAATKLTKMGYDYLAVGGMVPLNAASIHACLSAIREAIPQKTKLHILGFAKAGQISEFFDYGIASFDTTSPLLRAFKEARKNYYFPNADGELDFYTAIRIPQAHDNPKLARLVKSGDFNQDDLIRREKNALKLIREFDKGAASLEDTLIAVMDYTKPIIWDPKATEEATQRRLNENEKRYKRTLIDKPWKRCNCSICREISIEVMIFRASNRNKRRGIHNLGVYNDYLKSIRLVGKNGKYEKIRRYQSAAE